MKDLKIRKSGKYYQIGYYREGNWINLEHIGTAERALVLVRAAKELEAATYQVPLRTKNSSTKKEETSEKRTEVPI